MTGSQRATFLYDGECGICSEWVRYWQRLTGDSVDYRPFQEAAPEFPHIPVADLEQAVHLVEPDGTVSSGAGATFRLYRQDPPRSVLPWLYHHLPGFAAASEACYRLFARHRELLAFLTHLLWGRDLQPPRHEQTAWLFLRLLGAIYLAAFVSMAVQVTGLIGSHGLLPLERYLEALHGQLGPAAWWHAPMIFWLGADDLSLQAACWTGALLSVLVILNRFTLPSLVLLYGLYLSVFHAGQRFTGYQWDLLLLEAGFLAIFLPTGSRIVVWLYRWLVFRFLLLSGLVKILSGDPSWRNLTALDFHFETQPLPTPLAWYAAQLPDAVLRAATAATLVIELAVPFLILAPRRLRLAAAWITIGFQACILATGNYNFFNLLAMVLCLMLMDDAHLSACTPGFLRRGPGAKGAAGTAARLPLLLLAAVLVIAGVEQFAQLLVPGQQGRPGPVTRILYPLHIVNSYGPFAVMTTLRHEIILEGSRDGETWRAYEFRYKPGDPARAPSFCIPHQPRLDWQMWFAALRNPRNLGWFHNLLLRLLQNEPAVTGLLAHNPFPDQPPLTVRARFYEYHFASPAERAADGRWWRRQPVGEYYPPVSLSRR